MIRVHTSNGTYYDIDQEKHRARRVPGPGRNSMYGDGDWFSYRWLETISQGGGRSPEIEVGRSIYFVTGGNYDWRITTPITSIEEVADDADPA